jgi:acylphosphatase
MDAVMITRLHAIVEGHVQGVGYRMFVVEQARRLDINGWVRNRSNGTVELTAEGQRADLDELIRMLRDGPHYGTVTSVDAKFSEGNGEFKQFWFRETY